jgi:copper chaperone CopZ
MSMQCQYVHALDGRLRIRVVGLERSATTARLIEERLRSVDGVTSVHANPRTGNVLVLYDAQVTGRNEITAVLHALGVLPAPDVAVTPSPPGLVSRIAENVARFAVEAALQSAISALL